MPGRGFKAESGSVLPSVASVVRQDASAWDIDEFARAPVEASISLQAK